MKAIDTSTVDIKTYALAGSLKFVWQKLNNRLETYLI